LETADRERSKKKWEEEKDNGKGIHGFIFLNMNGIHIQEEEKYNLTIV